MAIPTLNTLSKEVSRTDLLQSTVRRELERRRAHLDAAADLGEVTISVRLTAGSLWVRGVTYQEERVCRQNNRP